MASRTRLFLRHLRSAQRAVGKAKLYCLVAAMTCIFCLVAAPGTATLAGYSAVATESAPFNSMVSTQVNGQSDALFSLPTDWQAHISENEQVHSPNVSSVTPTSELLHQSRELYQKEQYAEAAQLLEQVVETARSQGSDLEAAIALSNLSLAYQYLGRWDDAEVAIAASLAQLDIPEVSAPSLLAQALNAQGRLQFYRGNPEIALATWERATALFTEAGEPTAALRTQLNQAIALQGMGLYRRAIDLLEQITTHLEGQPNSPEQVLMLRRLGDALRVVGALDESAKMLQASRDMAERLHLPEAIATATLSLGNTAYARGDLQTAQTLYQETSALAPNQLLQVQADLNRVRTLLDLEQAPDAIHLVSALSRQMDQLPPGRAAIYARINLGDSLLRLAELNLEGASILTNPSNLAQSLAIAVEQARELQDICSESYALGILGKVYEQAGQWEDARQLTDQALLLAQQVNVPELRYRWEWQLGRILSHEQNRQDAIAAYTSAINTLQEVRRDLAAINPEAQFSFRSSVEPIHRELVSLLLAPGSEPSDAELAQARFTIESLQLAELDNFFREACLNAREVQIDTIDRQAAVLYPIILSDRLEVVLSLPGQPVSHHTSQVSAREVTAKTQTLLDNLRDRRHQNRAKRDSQELYNWLIHPIRDKLEASQVQTLVFVPDGVLRNVPMSALYDGESFLIEDYAVALAPTLQLLEASTIQTEQLSVLLGGITEATEGFSDLPNVESEVEQIHSQFTSQVILNQEFTNEVLKAAIDQVPYPIVHLATHGEFSSNLQDTFILTWDGRMNINDLRELLQATDINRQNPIELLVLSACRTAVGDDRAALGLAGMAVRSGARSTVASLWYVADDATSRMMVKFYENLATGTMTKAEALRQAQVAMIQIEDIQNNTSPDFQPYYWSPFVLIGNWL
jgi:CHAT domain-containing protein